MPEMRQRETIPDRPQASHRIGEPAECSPPGKVREHKSRWATKIPIGWLDSSLFICLAAFVLCAPLATKGAVTAIRAALLIWIVKILVEGRKFHRQPLVLPLLWFLLLTGASSAFSSEPLFSWGAMRGVTELTIAILVGQSLNSLRQIKILVGLLLAACLISVAITAWQYTAGIGVKLIADDQASVSLAQFGLLQGDIIQKVNQRKVYTSPELVASLDRLPPGSGLELTLVREITAAHLDVWMGDPVVHLRVRIGRKTALEETLKGPVVRFARGRPLRADGTLKHYFPYSEVMVLIGLVVWGLLVAPGSIGIGPRIALTLAFLAIAAVVVLTLTRISLVSLLLGCFLIGWKDASRKTRRLILVAVPLILLLSMTWVQKRRAQKWLDLNDPGTQYRFLMWRDSIKLIRAHPLLGVGLGSVMGHWQRWDLEAYRRFPLKSHFHSTPIQFAVECGLPTLAVWLWLMAAYGIFLIRLLTMCRESGWFPHGLASGILGGFLAVLLTSLLQYNFGDVEAMIIFWFLMGLTFALERVVVENYRTPQVAEGAGKA